MADLRLRQLGVATIFGIDRNPLPWVDEQAVAIEHANFFEQQDTEYSKAATKGDWHGDSGVWSNFEQMMEKRKAGGAN